MDRCILDTNVLSELMRQEPDPSVLEWFARRVTTTFLVTAITRAEIMLGIALLPSGKRRVLLADAADKMFREDFYNHCLPFDAACAGLYASIVAGHLRFGYTITTEDAQIAAIALVGNLPLATRNTKDFVHVDGLVLYDPWRPNQD